MRGEIKELLFIKVTVYLPLKVKSIKVEFWSLSAEVKGKICRWISKLFTFFFKKNAIWNICRYLKKIIPTRKYKTFS